MFLCCYCWCNCERFLVDAWVDVLHAVLFLLFFLFFLFSFSFSARILVVSHHAFTVREPLGDVSGSANHDFGTSVNGISGEIDASLNQTIPAFDDDG